VDQYSAVLSAAEAADLLGVQRQTLYAYVSRGWLRSVPGGRGPARRYLRSDVERLRARRGRGRGGLGSEPVLDSSITWFDERGPLYRGYPAVELATRDVPFEAVGELLLGGALPERAPRWEPAELSPTIALLTRALAPESPPLVWLQAALPLLGEADPGRYELAPERVRATARRLAPALARLLAARAGREPRAGSSVASAMQTALGARGGPQVRRALGRALVLLADHELNASTFAARVAASARADLYSCLQAALGALAGPRHGGASEDVAAFVERVGSPERAEMMVRDELRRGRLIPGFGHAIYHGLDPRARVLFDTARSLAPGSPVVHIVDAVAQAMERLGRPAANVDAALVSLAAATGIAFRELPGVFAVARSIGWAAHVLEQYAEPDLIRPRARHPGGADAYSSA
jgi:citrate synthase